ncbi:MobF family relaxase [Polynucleobacter sp. UK-Gri1-W3]|uniref:MobF family relaxase n=1 Tax=Polynucleobacter sp. UK-Gri1-W3 TaxID=1819737 RepID=UPI001C0BCA78|nr:MobF family relaxase [Polynucleobacter sp. UK-Gri1-W3]MBU3539061.1 relaxase domain-containing protein [Polynucleobacter sp. UK-Gri1-W3]
MIRCTPITSGEGAAKYFFDYANEASNGEWGGRAAEIMGLEGTSATREDFINTLEGKLTNQQTGQFQDLGINSKERRSGYDMTFSAPKSASIAALVYGDTRIADAYRESVKTALAQMEDLGAQYRQREGGQPVTYASNSLAYVTFEHETSRDGDPQLHIHAVIASITVDSQGKFHSLTNDELIQHKAYLKIGEMQQHDFARRCSDLGYTVVKDAKGNFELAEISARTIASMSKRSEGIKEHLKSMGINPDKASFEQKRAASLNTRQDKVETSREENVARWKAETGDIAFAKEGGGIQRVMTVETDKTFISQEKMDKAVGQAISHLSATESSFREIDLIKEVGRFSGHTATNAQITAAIADMKTDGNIVQHEGANRFITTRELQQEELKMLETATSTIDKFTPIVKGHDRAEELLKKADEAQLEKSTYALSGEQKAEILGILNSKDGVTLVQGSAGTGKTSALKVINEIAQSQGYKVIGTAVSSKATNEIISAGIESKNAAKFLADLNSIPRELQRKIEIAEARQANLSIGKVSVDANIRTLGIGLFADKYVVNLNDMTVYRSNSTGGLSTPLKTALYFVEAAANKVGYQSLKTMSKADTLTGKASNLIMSATVRVAEAIIKPGPDSFRPVLMGGVEHAAATALAISKIAIEKIAAQVEISTLRTQLDNFNKTGNVDGKRQLMVLDEASMIGTKEVAKIIDYCKKTETKLIIQGDSKQLGSVSGGRAFDQLKQTQLATHNLVEAVRFKTEQTKSINDSLNKGQYDQAIEKCSIKEVGLKKDDANYSKDANNALLYAETAKEYLKEIDTKIKGSANASVGVVVTSNADRIGCNEAVRVELKAAGKIGEKDFKFGHRESTKMTDAEKKNVSILKDKGVTHLQANQNISLKTPGGISIKKGEELRIVSWNTDKNELTVISDKGVRATINPAEIKGLDPMDSKQTRDFSKSDLVDVRAIIGSEYQMKDGKPVLNEQTGDKVKSPDYLSNGANGKIESISVRGAEIKFDDGRVIKVSAENMAKVDHAYARTAHGNQGRTVDKAIVAISEGSAGLVNKESAYVALTRAKESVTVVTTAKDAVIRNAIEMSDKTTALDAPRVKEQSFKRETTKDREKAPEQKEAKKPDFTR